MESPRFVIRCPKVIVRWDLTPFFSPDGKSRIRKAGKVVVRLKPAFEKVVTHGRVGAASD